MGGGGDPRCFYPHPHPLPPRREPGTRTRLSLTPDECSALATALLKELDRTDDPDHARTVRAVLERLTRR